MSKIASPRNLSRVVFSAVRADVLSGRLAPGSRLLPREIAAQHEVSVSVVREALTRLSEQGLVVAEPQLGFSVISLDLDDMRDLYRLRVLLEGTALRDAIEHGDIEYETRVIASHHRLERTPHLLADGSGQITDEWAAAHGEFHHQLLSASTSPRLRDLADRLRDTSELYRRWSGTLTTALPPRDIPDEHKALMQAVLDHDAEGGVALITGHINRTASLLETYAAHTPDTAQPTPRVAESGR
jgi:DNA-binding GntR family transcriptional regulator